MDSEIKCDYCDKKAAVIFLESQNKPKCPTCHKLNYEIGDKLNICSLKCNTSIFYDNYESKKQDNDIKVKVSICFEDECSYCGNPMFSYIKYAGKRCDNKM